MKTKLFALIPLLLCMGSASAPTPADKITGDYVEARTASVFAGACHYNGELVTTGRDAVMAWNIKSGTWAGVDLTGIRAMAAVASQANLGDEHATRQCELVIDTSATDAQMSAFADMVHAQNSAQLGRITSLRRASVTFQHTGRAFDVKADDFAAINIEAMPNDECCTQPSLVWYSPLISLEHRKVGFTKMAAYTAGRVGDPWQQSGENTAFYGSFTIQ